MQRNQFKLLLDKYFSGKATEQEEEEIFSVYESFQQTNNSPLRTKYQEKQLFASILQEIEIKERSKKRLRFIKAAAAFLGILGISVLCWQRSGVRGYTRLVRVVTLKTQDGQKKQLIMSDGTFIQLNSGSKLTYPDQFSEKTRDVELVGEAFFRVHHDPHHPFIVHTHTMDIKVLGTVFDVRAYPGDKRSETTLLQGSVEVSTKTGEKTMLKPNQTLVNQMTADRRDKNSIINIVPASLNKTSRQLRAAEWVQNDLTFENESFDQIATKLECWYHISIRFENQDIRTTRFTGTLNNADLFVVLEALKLTMPFKYRKEAADTLIIY